MKTRFDSMEQRVIGSFYFTMPSFYPGVTEECSVEEQQNLYAFICQTIKRIYDEPSLFYGKLHEDYGFPNVFTVAGSGHEELGVVMRKIYKDFQAFIEFLMDVGKNGEFNGESVAYKGKIPKKYSAILAILGIKTTKNELTNTGSPFFNALRWFSRIDRLNVRRFETCSFDDKHNYLAPVLSPLCGKESGACDIILDWLEKNGYKTVFLLDKYDKSDDCSVSYVKNINGKVQPVGFAYMGDSYHIGFSMEYRYTAEKPVFCTLRVQKMKDILADFGALPQDVQEFIVKHNKKCDNCRYCVQTDKTDTRPKAFVKAEYKGKHYLFCPYYPGFHYSFKDITEKDANDIITFLQTVERYALR